MNSTLKGKIIDEVEVPKVLKAYLFDNNVIEIVWNRDIEVIDKLELSEVQKAVKELGDGNKMPLYFTAHEFLVVSPEDEEFATSKEGTEYSLAIAVLLDSLALKIDYNSFVKRNKPVVPTMGFIDQEEAVAWLLEQYKKQSFNSLTL